jgi:hypothetical protein
MNEKLTVLALDAENVKRLKAVRIRPDGAPMVVIGGDNAQGKTSVLDAIEMALAGGRSIPGEPIRKGQKKAEVVLDLGDIKVRRVITPGGNRLEVTGRTGVPMASPQAVLDRLVGALSFDPLSFTRQKPRDQADTLLKLMGLNFAEVDKERADLFAERTVHNREVAQLEGALAKMEIVPGREAPVDVSALQARIEAARAQNAACDREGERAKALKRALAEALDHEADMRGEVERAMERLRTAEAKAKQASDEYEAQCAKVSGMPTTSTVELMEQIQQATAINARVKAREERAALEGRLEAKRAEAADCTRLIEDIDREKLEAVGKAASSFPVPGLGFGDSGVTLNGLPFEQASGAEQLRVSMAVGLALNPQLKVLLVRDGSLLDSANMKLIAEMAAAAGAQVWVERVGKGDASAVIIEDGEVVSGGYAGQVRDVQPGDEEADT